MFEPSTTRSSDTTSKDSPEQEKGQQQQSTEDGRSLHNICLSVQTSQQ
jgi:hypothetical protein